MGKPNDVKVNELYNAMCDVVGKSTALDVMTALGMMIAHPLQHMTPEVVDETFDYLRKVVDQALKRSDKVTN